MAIVPQPLTSSTSYILDLTTNIHFALSAMHCVMANSAAKIAERPVLRDISPSCHIWRSIFGKIAIFRFLLMRNSDILSLILLDLLLLIHYCFAKLVVCFALFVVVVAFVLVKLLLEFVEEGVILSLLKKEGVIYN